MRRVLPVVALALALGLVWFWQSSSPESQPGPLLPAAQPAGADGADPPPVEGGDGRELEAPADAARVGAGPGAGAQEPAPESPATPPPARPFEVVLVDPESGEGLPDCEVRVELQGRGALFLRSDPKGILRSPEPLDADSVRLVHEAQPGHPRFEVQHALDPDHFVLPVEGMRQVRAHRPRRRVHVRVVDPSPVAGARVLLAEQPRDLELAGRRLWAATSDVQGDAWLGPDDEEPEVYLLWAEHGERVSSLHTLDLEHLPSAGAPLLLALERGAEVTVSVVDEHGDPVVSTRIWQRWSELRQNFARTARRALTDARGHAEFRGLPPGEHVFDVRDLRSPYTKIESALELELGAREELTLALPAPSTRLAARGRVLDEAGEGLAGLLVGGSDAAGDSRFARSATDGSFEIWSRPSDTLLVAVDANLTSSLFAPRSVEVPFGTEGLIFRRVAQPREMRVLFEVVDARTRRPVAGAELWLLEPEPGRGELRLGRSAADGSLEALWSSARDDLTLGLWAPGYEDTRVSLPAQGSRAEGPTRVALEPGGSRRWRAIDFIGPTPLAGVRVLDTATGDELARSDAGGWFSLPSGSEPASLTLSLPGYVEGTADTRNRSSWYEPQLVMWSDDWEQRLEEARRREE